MLPTFCDCADSDASAAFLQKQVLQAACRQLIKALNDVVNHCQGSTNAVDISCYVELSPGDMMKIASAARSQLAIDKISLQLLTSATCLHDIITVLQAVWKIFLAAAACTS